MDFKMSVPLFVHVSVVLLTLSALVQYASCLDCVKQDTCSCSMDDNSGAVDLTSLGNPGNTPRFQDVPDPDGTMLFSYNPCGAFTEGACDDAAVCMQNSDKTSQSTVGNAERSAFSYAKGKVAVAYFAGSGIPTVSEVTLVCDKSACEPEFKALGLTGTNIFNMQMTTVCACPGGCTASGPVSCAAKSSGGGLTGGSIFLILLFTLVAVYLVAGVLFMKFAKHSTGTDLIPNKDFWKTIPSLIVSGMKFSLCFWRRKGGSQFDSI